MVFAGTAEYRKRALRAPLGPEYDRLVAEQGGRRAADRELLRRRRAHDGLRLAPLGPDDLDYYSTSWDHVQGGFIDDPVVALHGADRLIRALMHDRGYPGEDRGEQLALLSVEHGRALSGYRDATQVAQRARLDPDNASTEE